MFCSKCGTENEENAKFCSKCGEKLEKGKEKEKKTEKKVSTMPLDQGGVRKAIKAASKSKVASSLIGATAIYLVALVVISMISSSISIDNADTKITVAYGFSELLTVLVSLIFSLGIMMVGFDAVRGKEYKWTDVFTKPFNHLDRLGYLLLMGVACTVICFAAGLLMIIPLLGFFVLIAFIVAVIYYFPTISIFSLMIADVEKNTKIDFMETVKKSIELSKGNRVEFYGMVFSFIGWYLLAICTFGILYIWLTPYMELSLINMYRKWINEEGVESTETGLSNGTVIGLTAGGCGCGCIVVFVFFIGIIAALIAATNVGKDNPSIRSFIDKYVPAEDKAEIEADWNDIFDEYNSNINK